VSRTARFQNAFLMLVSLLLAIVLWLHVQSQAAPNVALRPFNLKVKLNGLSPEYVVVKDPQMVTVSISGVDDPKNIGGEPVASIDLTDAHVGVNSCKVDLEAPPGVRLDQLRVNPRKVVVELDSRVTVRRSVQLKLSGLQSDDLIFNGVTIQPTQVDISGPKKLVDSVRQIRVIFDLSTARPGVSQALTVEPLNKDDKIVRMVTCDPTAIVARASLLPAPTKKSLIVTPKWTGQPAFGYEITSIEVLPNMVEATAKSELLSRLATLETEPVSVEGLKEDKEIEVRMIVPHGVVIGVSPVVRVHVIVSKARSAGEEPKVSP
jgi:YbbR domain-containing protein